MESGWTRGSAPARGATGLDREAPGIVTEAVGGACGLSLPAKTDVTGPGPAAKAEGGRRKFRVVKACLRAEFAQLGADIRVECAQLTSTLILWMVIQSLATSVLMAALTATLVKLLC